jgi:hypothetical protein
VTKQGSNLLQSAIEADALPDELFVYDLRSGHPRRGSLESNQRILWEPLGASLRRRVYGAGQIGCHRCRITREPHRVLRKSEREESEFSD